MQNISRIHAAMWWKNLAADFKKCLKCSSTKDKVDCHSFDHIVRETLTFSPDK